MRMLSIKCFYNSNYKWNLWLNFGILTILLVFACFAHLLICFFFSPLLLFLFSPLAPNFVSSFTQGDFVYFFFRETAVEFINCGKVSGEDIIDMDNRYVWIDMPCIYACGHNWKRKGIGSDSSGSAAMFRRPFCLLSYSCTLPASTWAAILVFACGFCWFQLSAAWPNTVIGLLKGDWLYLFMGCVCWLSICGCMGMGRGMGMGISLSASTCALIFIFYAISGDLFARCTRLQMG